MKKLSLGIPLLLLATGCSHQKPMTYERAVAAAQLENTDNLCLASVSNTQYKNIVDAELSRRGAVCDWAKVQLMMQAQAAQAAEQQRLNAIRAQLYQDISKNMQQMTYRPPIQPVQQQPIYDNPPPQQPTNINCTTTHSGNQAQTHCQ